MHILGLDNVDDVVNGIGEYFLIFLVWAAMRFLTPPFHLNLVTPAVANNINLQHASCLSSYSTKCEVEFSI